MSWEYRRKTWDLLETLPNYSRTKRPERTSTPFFERSLTPRQPRRLADGVTVTERLQYQRHADAANTEGVSWIGNTRMSKAIGLSVKQVSRNNAALVALGLLKVHAPANQHTPVRYRVCVPDISAKTHMSMLNALTDSGAIATPLANHGDSAASPDVCVPAQDARPDIMELQTGHRESSGRTYVSPDPLIRKNLDPERESRARVRASHAGHAVCGRICLTTYQREQFIGLYGGDPIVAKRDVETWARGVCQRFTTGSEHDTIIDSHPMKFWDERWKDFAVEIAFARRRGVA